MRRAWAVLVLAGGLWGVAFLALNAATPPQPWPPIPATVQGMAGPITVRVIPNPKDEEGNELWGSWEQSTRVIEIDATAPLEFRWHTLFHELCHASLGDSGAVNLLDADEQEAVCDAAASGRIQEMRGGGLH